MNPYQAKVVMFQAHVDKCPECQQAKFNGNYCLEGFQLCEDLNAFFKPVEQVRKVA